MITFSLIVWFSFLWFIAGLLSGITSFGGNLVAVPIIALSIDPRDAILFGCISCSAIFLAISLIYWRKIIWMETCYLTLGALAGIPPGIWFLARAGSKSLLLAASAAIGVFLLWQFCSGLLGKETRIFSKKFAFPMGFLSGVMMGSVGMGGPPLVLYAFLRKLTKEQTMGVVNAASVAIMLIELPLQYNAGLLTLNLIKPALAGAVFAFSGVLASLPIVKRLNIVLFRKLLLAMLAFSALVLLWRAV